jgi:polyadenylate-binding protein
MLIYDIVSHPQVSRDDETGISRGCGFVTMRSFTEARRAINALDGFVSHTNFAFCVVSS